MNHPIRYFKMGKNKKAGLQESAVNLIKRGIIEYKDSQHEKTVKQWTN